MFQILKTYLTAVRIRPVPRNFLKGRPNFLRRGPSRLKKFFATQKLFFLYPYRHLFAGGAGPGPMGHPLRYVPGPNFWSISVILENNSTLDFFSENRFLKFETYLFLCNSMSSIQPLQKKFC